MSGQYVYSAKEYVESVQLDPTVLVEQNVAWEEQADDCEETVNFVDANDTLTETIDESYVTADVNNTTEYFSLDTTSETILNDITDVSLESSKINGGALCAEQENNESIDVSDHQVVLFKIDDSDDLYGVQVAQDEEGNFQKYQFKVRQNEEGNLEAVPESIQILPLDNDCDEIGEAETVTEENEEISQNEEEEEVVEHIDEPASLFIKQEHVGEQFFESVSSHEQIEDVEEEEEEEENMYERDTKEGILDVAAPTVVHKQEAYDPEEVVSETEAYGTEGSEQYFVQPPEDVNGDINESSGYFVSTEEAHVNEADEEQEDEGPVVESSEPYEQLFVKENHLIEEKDMSNEELADVVDGEPAFEEEPPFEDESPFEEDTRLSHNSESMQENMNESDNDYEIAEGSHITGETGNHLDELHVNDELSAFEEDFGKQSPKTRKLIKNVIRKFKVKKNNDGNKIANTYYLIKHPEKENVGAVTANVVLRPNPRSILKCSVTSVEPKKDIEDEIYEKRFAKSKEAQKARLFHNFIAQTKIIHAPVRQQRLPRKQQIKPMERTDEEIIVQEVVVSSNGFVETSEEGVLIERKSIKPTEYIQLSDSDEDYDPKAKHKRKRKHRKRKPQIEITISDSEDDWSDNSVIEINGSDSNEEEKSTNSAKRPRGRPRKNSSSTDANPSAERDKNEEKDNNNVKRPRGRPPKIPRKKSVDVKNGHSIRATNVIILNTNNKCPKCPKSFPSEGSLRTHMQYHNFNEPNKDLAREEEVDKNKYKCDICDETFKNNFLLTRHTDLHNKKNKISCTFCKNVFNDLSQLTKHKRTHIKQQMFKTTTVPKVSPKKMRMRQRRTTPKKPEFKCNDCSKVVSNSSALLAHTRMHKKYLCSNCGKKFPSNLMLQNHVRRSCVKKKRPSFVSRKTFPKPRARMSSRVKPQRNNTVAASTTEKTTKEPTNLKVTRSTVVTNIKCDSCPMTFATYTSLYKHKVSKHDLETPDRLVKNISSPRTTFKPRGEHSGVPPSEKLKRAFKELRSKLDK